MHRAASAAFACLRQRWPHAREIVVFCGPGNNGGDGFLIAELALSAGLQTTLYFLGDKHKASGDALAALQAYETAGGCIQGYDNPVSVVCDVVVDALLGTGLSRPVEGRFLTAVNDINAAAAGGAGVLAVDIPSGLDAGTGKIWGTAVRANATATFIGHKLGMLTGTGPTHAGAINFFTLDAPPAIYEHVPALAYRINACDLSSAFPARVQDAHKGANGHVLCVGGNYGMSGAISMAAQAALRGGAGLVSVATRQQHAVQITQARPELMCRGAEHVTDLEPMLAAATCAAIGPGLGQDAWAQALLARLLDTNKALVMDADALNLLALEPWARGQWILTPHPGEAARLLGVKTPEVQADRRAAVLEIAERYNAAVILKGAGSLIAAPGSDVWLCDRGNPGMAVGGMGDVLTGVVAALLAQLLATGVGQRQALEIAARIATFVHACAGDAAAHDGGQRGLLACDLLPYLRRGVNPA